MTNSRALASNPRQTLQQRSATQTKIEFSEHLKIGTAILHYRKMPIQGLELALSKYQVSTVSTQLRQMVYRTARNYLSSNPMTLRVAVVHFNRLRSGLRPSPSSAGPYTLQATPSPWFTAHTRTRTHTRTRRTPRSASPSETLLALRAQRNAVKHPPSVSFLTASYNVTGFISPSYGL